MDPDTKQNKRRLYNRKWISEKRRKLQMQSQEKLSDSNTLIKLNSVQSAHSRENDYDAQNPQALNDQSGCDQGPSESNNSGELDLNFAAHNTCSSKDYETARKCLKKAEETSNLESDDSRKRKLPSRLIREIESDADVESDKEGMPSPPKTKFLQKRNLYKQPTPTCIREDSTLLPLSPSPLSPSSHPPAARSQILVSNSVKRELQSTPVHRSPRSKPGYTRHSTEKSPERAASTPTAASTSTSDPRPIPAATNTGTFVSMRSEETILKMLHRILSKMDTLLKDVAAIKRHLISSGDIDDIESLLPSGNKLNSVQEVEIFQETLDEHSKKKLINALAALQGGDNAGEICRAIMRAVMSNCCMSKFSGTGQKGKIAFIGTPMYKIIVSAAQKASKKTLSVESIKRGVLHVLRFAPYHPGGSHYVNKKKGRKLSRLSGAPPGGKLQESE